PTAGLQNLWPTQVPVYIGIAGAAVDPAGRTVGFICNNTGGAGPGIFAGTGILTYNKAVTPSKVYDRMANVMIVGEQSGIFSDGSDTGSRYFGGFSGSPMNAAGFQSNLVAKWPCGNPPTGSFDVWSQAVSTVRYSVNTKSSSSAGTGSTGPNTILSSMHPG